MTIFNAPSIYEQPTIYKGGGGSPTPPGPQPPEYVENVEVLLNGIIETEQPVNGTVSPTVDSTFPIENLEVYNSANVTPNTGVQFSSKIPAGNEFTLDFWFKGISHDYQYTPSIIGFKDVSFMECNWNNGLTDFYWTSFQQNGLWRFHIDLGAWHHIAVENKPISATEDERYLFVDGELKQHYNNYSHVDFSAHDLVFGGAYPHSRYNLAQICIRNEIVWTENFTPPTRAYSLY